MFNKYINFADTIGFLVRITATSTTNINVRILMPLTKFKMLIFKKRFMPFRKFRRQCYSLNKPLPSRWHMAFLTLKYMFELVISLSSGYCYPQFVLVGSVYTRKHKAQQTLVLHVVTFPTKRNNNCS